MVQAPHTPCSHPTWVPVRPSCPRRKSTNVRRGSTGPSYGTPFTVGRTCRGATNTPPGPRSSANHRFRQRSSCQHPGYMASVLSRGVDIGQWGLDLVTGLLPRFRKELLARHLPHEGLLRPMRAHGVGPRPRLRAQGERTGRILCGGICVCQRAADGAAIADLRMCDEARGRVEEWLASLHELRTFDRALPGERTDIQPAVALTDVVQAIDAIQVDQHARARQSHVEEWHEAPPTRPDLGLAFVLLKERYRLFYRTRIEVVEGRWFHWSVSIAAPADSPRRRLLSLHGDLAR